MTPKMWNSQAEKCRLIVEVKKRAKKAKINAKNDALAVYQWYKGMKLTKDKPKKGKMSAQILSILWYFKKGPKKAKI